MKCNACGTFDGEPVYEMQPSGRVTPQCPICSNIMAAPEPARVAGVTASGSVVATHANDRAIANLFGAAPSAPGDIVATVKARIAAIDVELSTMRKLETERAKLARMLAAAEPEEN